MKKIWKKVVVFALVALPFVISTVGNLTLWPGKGGKWFRFFIWIAAVV